MAAYTSQATGNWSASSTWTTTPPSGGPGNGDTVTIAAGNTVTLDGAAGPSANGHVTIGSDSGTAVTLNSNGSALTLASGTQLLVKGNFVFGSSYLGTFTLTLSAGSTFQFYPPASTTFSFTFVGYQNCKIICNGTSGSHCTFGVNTSRGSGVGNATMLKEANANTGVVSAAYTDFSNFGTSSVWGIVSCAYGANPISITHCTFTNCNYQCYAATPWDNAFTFQNNVFSSSVAFSTGQMADFDITSTTFGGSYTRLIDSNVFDGIIFFDGIVQPTFTNNVCANSISIQSGSPWTNASQFANNFIYGNPSGGSNLIVNAQGPIQNCYLYNTSSSNPHYLSIDNSQTASSVTGFLFESSGTGGYGDCIFPPTISSGSPTCAVRNCIVLPDATTGTACSSGKLVSDLQTGNVAVTAEHNTFYGGGATSDVNTSVAALGETGGGEYSGCIASCRANLCWASSSGGAAVLACNDQSTAGTSTVGNVTVAGYNGFWNPTTGTDYYNSSTAQTGVTGYKNIRISANTTYPNATIGTGDYSGNPSFVDSTRCLAAWGGTTAGGGTATAAAAIATLTANPALIGQATTGLLAWVRAGFRPTNSAFEATGWSGDTSTADAAGNSWPGSTPGFGAMAYYAGSTATGSGAITLGNLAVSGSGGFVSPASGAITLGSLTPSGSGGFMAPGSGVITLGSLTPAGAGSLSDSGSGSVILGSLGISGAGTFAAPGSGAITLGSLAATGAGSFATTASGAVMFGSLTPSGSGGFAVTASGSIALASLTVAGSGSFTGVGNSTGSGSLMLAALAAAGVASFTVPASGAIMLGSITPAGLGGFTATASGTVILASLTVSGSGLAAGPAASTGSGAITFAGLSVAGSGGFGTSAHGAITLGSIIVVGMSGYIALYLPYEFTSILIATANADPWGIDPEQTTLITRGLTSSD